MVPGVLAAPVRPTTRAPQSAACRSDLTSTQTYSRMSTRSTPPAKREPKPPSKLYLQSRQATHRCRTGFERVATQQQYAQVRQLLHLWRQCCEAVARQPQFGDGPPISILPARTQRTSAMSAAPVQQASKARSDVRLRTPARAPR